MRETKREKKTAREKRRDGAQRKKAGARATPARVARHRARTRGNARKAARADPPSDLASRRARAFASPPTFRLKQLSVKPLEANVQLWQMGLLPWLQIFLTIGALELLTEATCKPHYFSKEARDSSSSSSSECLAL